mgnify:CR=1 FL=1
MEICCFFSFCDVFSAVSRSISWARCLPVVTTESVEARLLLKSESSPQMRLSLRN